MNNPRYQYLSGNRYIDYDDSISVFLESNINNTTLLYRRIDGVPYIFDFAQMQQIDVKNNVKRKFRRV